MDEHYWETGEVEDDLHITKLLQEFGIEEYVPENEDLVE